MKIINNQKGMVPVILIIAGVVIVLGVLVTLLQFVVSKNKPAASPSPVPKAATGYNPADPKYKGCEDRDYTGCDGPEAFTWKDDGKR